MDVINVSKIYFKAYKVLMDIRRLNVCKRWQKRQNNSWKRPCWLVVSLLLWAICVIR